MSIWNSFLVFLGVRPAEVKATTWWGIDQETKEVDLNDFALELSKSEGLTKKVPVTQVKELVGILGARWRNLPEEDVKAEISAIINRAGLRSEHAE